MRVVLSEDLEGSLDTLDAKVAAFGSQEVQQLLEGWFELQTAILQPFFPIRSTRKTDIALRHFEPDEEDVIELERRRSLVGEAEHVALALREQVAKELRS